MNSMASTETLSFLVFQMINDVQLSVFANILGVTVFLLVVLYHYIAANNPRGFAG